MDEYFYEDNTIDKCLSCEKPDCDDCIEEEAMRIFADTPYPIRLRTTTQQEVYNLYKTGYTDTEIAEKLNLSKSTISYTRQFLKLPTLDTCLDTEERRELINTWIQLNTKN